MNTVLISLALLCAASLQEADGEPTYLQILRTLVLFYNKGTGGFECEGYKISATCVIISGTCATRLRSIRKENVHATIDRDIAQGNQGPFYDLTVIKSPTSPSCLNALAIVKLEIPSSDPKRSDFVRFPTRGCSCSRPTYLVYRSPNVTCGCPAGNHIRRIVGAANTAIPGCGSSTIIKSPGDSVTCLGSFSGLFRSDLSFPKLQGVPNFDLSFAINLGSLCVESIIRFSDLGMASIFDQVSIIVTGFGEKLTTTTL